MTADVRLVLNDYGIQVNDIGPAFLEDYRATVINNEVEHFLCAANINAKGLQTN